MLLQKLSLYAKTSPQNAYCCLTKCFQQKINFVIRTTPQTSNVMEKVESALRNQFIPALTGHEPPDDNLREVYALPLRLGGLNILNPSTLTDDYTDSIELSKPLSHGNPLQAELIQERKQHDMKNAKIRKNKDTLEKLKKDLDQQTSYSLSLSSEKGASNWLNAMPLKKYNFCLTKSEFRDGLDLRYGRELKKTPSSCPCGENFSLTHALHCAKGGYSHIRHNEIRDTFASLLKEACYDVEIEPKLQSLQGESFPKKTTSTDDDARLDIKANGLWDTRFSKTFFDVKIFNPLASSCPKTPKEAYSYQEQTKRLKYETRIIEVEINSFNPLIFACTGGTGPSASGVMKRLADKMSDKKHER